jgi:hypothetical protein
MAAVHVETSALVKRYVAEVGSVWLITPARAQQHSVDNTPLHRTIPARLSCAS